MARRSQLGSLTGWTAIVSSLDGIFSRRKETRLRNSATQSDTQENVKREEHPPGLRHTAGEPTNRRFLHHICCRYLCFTAGELVFLHPVCFFRTVAAVDQPASFRSHSRLPHHSLFSMTPRKLKLVIVDTSFCCAVSESGMLPAGNLDQLYVI